MVANGSGSKMEKIHILCTDCSMAVNGSPPPSATTNTGLSSSKIQSIISIQQKRLETIRGILGKVTHCG